MTDQNDRPINGTHRHLNGTKKETLNSFSEKNHFLVRLANELIKGIVEEGKEKGLVANITLCMEVHKEGDHDSRTNNVLGSKKSTDETVKQILDIAARTAAYHIVDQPHAENDVKKSIKRSKALYSDDTLENLRKVTTAISLADKLFNDDNNPESLIAAILKDILKGGRNG